MKTEYKYLIFMQTDSSGLKTQIWECRNKNSNDLLGIVKWFSNWRQYCYFTVVNAVYSTGCMDDINHFINQLMEERKKNKDEHGNIK